jgi:hypothetical protein
MPAVAERLALASFMAWEFWAAFQLIQPLHVPRRAPVDAAAK